MKITFRKLGVIFLALFMVLGLSQTSFGQELIVNGGFENWTAGSPETVNDWKYGSATGASYVKEALIKKSGEYSVKLIHTGTSGTAKLTSMSIPVVAGKQYTFTMDYYVVSSNETVGKENGLRYWGVWNNGKANLTDQTKPLIADYDNLQPKDYLAKPYGEWRRVNLTVTAPETAVKFTMDLRWYNGVTCYVDNVSLVEATASNVVATPVFSVPEGPISIATDVAITCATADAKIRYTTDGVEPSAIVGTEYTTAINIAATTTIKAIAYKDGMENSAIASATYTMTDPSIPIVTIAELKTKTPSEDAKYMLKNLIYIGAGDENIDPTAYMQDAEGNGLAAMPNGNPFEALTSGDVFDMVATWQNVGMGLIASVPDKVTKTGRTAELNIASVTIETVAADLTKYNWRLIKINNVNYEYIQDELSGKITSGSKSFSVSEAFFEIPKDAKTNINISGIFATSFGGTIIPRSIADFEVNTNDPKVVVSETALAFGDVTSTTTKPMTFTVTPKNLTGDLTIAATGEGFTVSPATIAKATTAATTVTVTFAPTTVKAYTGTVTISGGGLAISSTVALTGNGVNKPEPSANLIVNGDFENWTGETLNDWTYTTAEGASYAKETAIKEGGECSLKLMHTGTKGTAKLTATLVNVTAGEEYTLTMDYYMVSSNETVGKENGLRYWGTWKNGTTSINEASDIAGWNSLQMGENYLPAKPYGEWRRVNLTVTAPETATAMSMDIRWYNGVTCYVDNMSFKVAGETSTLDAPIAKEATDITSNRFTANWNAVTGATSYLLTVSNEEGLVFRDKEVNETSFNVTELNPDTEYTYSVKAKNAETVSDYSNIISCTTTGVGVNDLENSTRIFASDKTINVELTEDANVTVFNINGRVVATSIGSSKITVNTTGTYIVRVATANNSIAKKLVIR